MKVREGSNVKITYYGTGDGYGIPEPFCSCRLCSYARAHGGKDIRSRSQATVGDLMIDFSHDAFMHTVYGGLDMRNYKHVLITHGHFDHYAREQLTGRYVTDENWTFYLPRRRPRPSVSACRKTCKGPRAIRPVARQKLPIQCPSCPWISWGIA